MLRLGCLIWCALMFVGCSAQVEEKPPLEDAGPQMSQEEINKRMQESMERGNTGGRYGRPQGR